MATKIKKYTCPVCQRTFKAQQYFIQHIRQAKNPKCKLDFQLKLRGLSPPEQILPQKRGKSGENTPIAAQKTVRRPLVFTPEVVVDQSHHQISPQEEEQQQHTPPDNNDDDHIPLPVDGDSDFEDVIPPPVIPVLPAAPLNNAPDNPRIQSKKRQMMDDFKEYVNDSVKNRAWMDAGSQAAIELMQVLHQNGILSLYDAIMDWHLRHLDTKKRVTKKQVLTTLRERYNMDDCKPHLVRVNLPSSGLKANIPCHNARSMMIDLLTDPRIIPDDYLWFDNNPLGSPPAEWMELRDINDGLAYRKTYEELILPKPYTHSGRRRVLLPLIFYMDGCCTGWNENLVVELMKFTLGIFTSKAREKEHLWRAIGAVPQFQKVKAKAAALLEQSGEKYANEYLSGSDSEDEDRLFTREFEVGEYINSSDEEEEMCNIHLPNTHSQDLHVILKVILSGMKEICDLGGFDWDLCHNGELVPVHFVPFTLAMKGDTVEHDKHTGHYGSRTQGVKCLCRYCVCPAEETDNAYADFPRKNPNMIRELVRKGNMEALKDISQQYLFNVWYEFGFGLHNQLSIHGACPMEILHWIQLGWFKYSREVLFEQLGPYSKLAEKINLIASQMGFLFQRQSDRAYPRTKFTKGVQKGTLMAHEMSGLMLVLVATLRSRQGRNAILQDEQANFPTQDAISHWVMLLETQLQFESWLKSTSMSVAVVIRLRTKVRELMELTKTVGRREKGMGYKINNFHATKHVPDDILMFGPPHSVNTKSNEMHHKADKQSARITQKRPGTFDYQCAKSIEDRRVLAMAIQELKGRPRWDYFKGFQRQNQLKSELYERLEAKTSPKQQQTGHLNRPIATGVRALFEYDEEEEGYGYKVNSSMKKKYRYRYPQFIVDAVADLSEEVAEFTSAISIFSEMRMPDRKLYRASPYYQGKPWYDWAMCRVGEQIEGFEQRIVPVHIRCFVDLTFLPAQNSTRYLPQMYMIAETTRLTPDMDEINLSDLFVPYSKYQAPNQPTQCLMQVLPVSAIVQPACVIPDIEEGNLAYLRIRPTSEWSKMFEAWVNQPHLINHEEPAIGN